MGGLEGWEGLGGLEGIRGCGRAPGNAMVTTSIIAELEKASTFTQDINYQDIDFHSPSALHSPQKSPHVSLLSPQLQTLFSSKLYFFPNFFFSNLLSFFFKLCRSFLMAGCSALSTSWLSIKTAFVWRLFLHWVF